jgi:hypothetical protein
MKTRLLVALIAGLFAAVLALPAMGQSTRQITIAGTTSIQPTASGTDAIAWPEFATALDDTAGGSASGLDNPNAFVNRSLSNGKTSQGVSVNSGKKAKSNPTLINSFAGLNHRQQRLANGGNQFSVEPPDQGLCAGNGFVLETVNDVLRVFGTAGNPLIGVTDLNSFYGYAAAINRSTGVRGPFVTDPSCYFDPDTQRWFHVVLTLDTHSNGSFIGTNHLDIAVSQTSDPTGSWNIYRLPVQDDGTDGTPNHGCSFGPCLGDYPHIGADANGFYITTNEYSFFGPEFIAAQIYALSKRALASGAASVTVTLFNTAGFVSGNPGFTVWPATSPGSIYATGAGGTEYFLSSNAAAEANGNGTSTQIILWGLTNTQSLNTASPALTISNSAVTVNPYAIPPKSDQKAGDFPLGQCLNDTACSTFLNGTTDPFAPEVESHLDSNDTRMQQVVYANGKLWAALDTALTVSSVNKAGVEWFIAKPQLTGSAVKGSIILQGYLALANNNLTYPAVGVTPGGRGIIAFTLVGGDNYPSAAYTSLDASVGAGDINVAAAGAGPDDGFTSYKFYVGNPPRTRWGDYGATAVVGNSIWFASEYIGQTCTLAQYEAAPFGSCGGTRSSLANWDTRISLVKP